MKSCLAVMSMTLLWSFVAQTASAALVGYWPLDGDLLDYSANSNNGTFNGNAQFSSDVPAAIGAGQSVFFDGDGDFVDLGNNGGVSGAYNFTTNNWTIAGWIKLESTGDWVLFANGANNAGGVRTNLWQENDGLTTAVITVDDDVHNPKPELKGGTLSVGTWHHLAATRNGNQLALYLDGVLATAEVNETNNPDGDNPLTLPDDFDLTAITQRNAFLGANDILNQPAGTALQNFLEGYVDDVAVFDQALSAEIIAQLAAGTLSPLAVPEPNSMLLFWLATAAILARGRRWRTRKQGDA